MHIFYGLAPHRKTNLQNWRLSPQVQFVWEINQDPGHHFNKSCTERKGGTYFLSRFIACKYINYQTPLLYVHAIITIALLSFTLKFGEQEKRHHEYIMDFASFE